MIIITKNVGEFRAVYGDCIPSTQAVMSHDCSQIPPNRLVTVTRLLQELMLLMIISSLPNLLNAWYSALYCPSDHSDINADVNENLIKHFMRAHVLMLRNISIGYAIAIENRVMASVKKSRNLSAFHRLGLLYLPLNFLILSTLFLFTRGVYPTWQA